MRRDLRRPLVRDLQELAQRWRPVSSHQPMRKTTSTACS
jgi:hypothetical protein